MLEGRPLKGYDLERLKEFLKSMDLDYDTGIEYSICLEDEDYRIIAAEGIELSVYGTPIQNKDWNWELRGNLAWNGQRRLGTGQRNRCFKRLSRLPSF